LYLYLRVAEAQPIEPLLVAIRESLVRTNKLEPHSSQVQGAKQLRMPNLEQRESRSGVGESEGDKLIPYLHPIWKIV